MGALYIQTHCFLLGDNSSIIEILQGRSSLASLSIALNNNIIAILLGGHRSVVKLVSQLLVAKLIGRKTHRSQNSSVSFYRNSTLYTSLGLIISKIL
jgi:hypothetical protein